MTGGQVLRVERAGPDRELAVLVLDRPDVLNAIDSALLAALHDTLDTLEAAPPRGVILTGAGDRAFSSGMDLKERAAFSDDDLRAQRARIVDLIRRVHELPMPTIACIQGLAADIFKVALVRLDRALEEAGSASRLILQVHDEVILEVTPDELDEVTDLVLDAMSGAFALRVPLEVNLTVGDSWAAAKG